MTPPRSRSSKGPSAWTRISPWRIVLLGTNYFNLGQHARAAESIRKAYELRGRTSEREKLYISASYQDLVTGNLEAARTAYELMAQTYPRDPASRVPTWLSFTFSWENMRRRSQRHRRY